MKLTRAQTSSRRGKAKTPNLSPALFLRFSVALFYFSFSLLGPPMWELRISLVLLPSSPCLRAATFLGRLLCTSSVRDVDPEVRLVQQTFKLSTEFDKG